MDTRVRDIDEHIWLKFRALCLKERTSANEAQKRLIYHAVKVGKLPDNRRD